MGRNGLSGARWLRWGAVILWMAVIFVFSAQPKSALPDYGQADFPIKKLAHTGEYAILGALIAWAAGRGHGWRAWLLAVAYAASDEIHQMFVPGRTARLLDVGIDSVGAGMGILLIIWWLASRSHSPPHQE